MKSRRVLVGGCILVAIAGLFVFFFSTAPAVPAPSSSDPPPITWTPKKLTEAVFAGQSKPVPVSFTSSVNLDNVLVRVVPELQPYLTAEPTTFATVRAHEPVTITLTFNLNSGTLSQTINGTVQLKKLRAGENVGATDNLPHPLPVVLTMVSPLLPTLAELARQSPLVVIGNVTSVGSAYDTTGSEVFTYTRVTPARVLKGSNRGDIVVQTEGGVIDDEVWGCMECPKFRIGEKVLLLLEGPDTTQHYTVVSDAVGAFHIVTDPTSGEIALVDRAYRQSESIWPQEPNTAAFLLRSEQRSVTLPELIAALGFSP